MFNLVHLRFFYDASRLGSVTEAAKANYVSQSALSQGIKKLERDLGFSLITHQKNRFILTEEGRLAFSHARRIFSEIEVMQEELNSLSGQVAGSITFACTNSIARALIPKALLKCRQEYPLLKVNFRRGSIRFILDQLSSGKVDFAIVVDGERFQSFEKHRIKSGEFYVYKHPECCLDWEEGIYVDHVDSPEMEVIRGKCPEIKVLEELSGWGMVEEFVKQGLGPGLLPDFMKDDLSMKKVRTGIPEIPYSIAAVRQKGLPFSKTMEAFVSLL